MLNRFAKMAVVVCLFLLISSLTVMAQTTDDTQIGVRAHIDSVMANQTKETLFISVDRLHELLTDDNPGNDPFVIDLKKPEHYELGHIDNATLMSLFTIASEDSLAEIPKNKTVVVYCYTGQTGAMTTILLKLMGYENVRNLKFGMQAWTKNDTVNPTRYDPATCGKNYSVVSGVQEAVEEMAVEEINVTNLSGYIESVMGNQTKKTLFMSVDKLHELLTDANETNDPFIIDIRKLEHYELGHIDNATLMSLFRIASENSLAEIPKNKTVVVYCYTGQTGAMTTILLKLMGYENVRNLKFGMQAWTPNETISPTRYVPEESGRDYEFVGTAAKAS